MLQKCVPALKEQFSGEVICNVWSPGCPVTQTVFVSRSKLQWLNPHVKFYDVPLIFASLIALVQHSILGGSPGISVRTSKLVGLCGFVSVGGRPEDSEWLPVLHLLHL